MPTDVMGAALVLAHPPGLTTPIQIRAIDSENRIPSAPIRSLAGCITSTSSRPPVRDEIFADDRSAAEQGRRSRAAQLAWRHRDSKQYFDAASLSDGTLRFIALARLLEEIRQSQQQLASLADDGPAALPAAQNQDLQRFLMSLSTAWHAREVRPTERARPRASHHWRTRKDPFENTWPMIMAWFEESPEETALALFRRLQTMHPGAFPDNQLRTLQRRVCQWRRRRHGNWSLVWTTLQHCPA